MKNKAQQPIVRVLRIAGVFALAVVGLIAFALGALAWDVAYAVKASYGAVAWMQVFFFSAGAFLVLLAGYVMMNQDYRFGYTMAALFIGSLAILSTGAANQLWLQDRGAGQSIGVDYHHMGVQHWAMAYEKDAYAKPTFRELNEMALATAESKFLEMRDFLYSLPYKQKLKEAWDGVMREREYFEEKQRAMEKKQGRAND